MTNLLFLENTLADWLIAAGIAAAGVFLLMLALKVLLRRVANQARTTKTEIDDFVVEVLSKTHPLFIVIVSFSFGAQYLTFPEQVDKVRTVILVVAFVLQSGIWINAVISFWLDRTIRARMSSDAASTSTIAAIGFLAKLALWSVVLLLALDNLGINITAFVAGLGIGGIAVALATQKILGDLFASLSIVLDKPFVLGDFIVVQDHMGTVEHIGLKTTRLRSLTGEQLIISNSDLLDSRIQNFRRMQERRVLFTISLPYETSHEKVAKVSGILKEVVENRKEIRFDRAHLKQFTPSGVEFEVVYYVLQADFNVYMDIQQEINLDLFKRFEIEGIEFARPAQQLQLHLQNGNDQAAIVGSKNP